MDKKMQQQRTAGQKQEQGEPMSPEKVPNNRTEEGEMPESEAGSLGSRKGKGRWGRLPGKVVEKYYDNGARQLPERYRLLLEEYFRRLPLTEGK